MAATRALRPMGLLEIVDQTFRVYRSNFWLFFGVSAVAYVPFGLLQALPGAGKIAVLLVLPAILVTIGALTKAVSDRYLGEEATVGGVYRNVARRFWPFALTLLVAGLFVLSGVILLVVGAVVFAVWCSFLIEVFIIEDKRYLQAVWRSRFLVGQGVWIQVAVLSFLTSILTYLIQAAIMLPFFPLLSATGEAEGIAFLPFGIATGLGNALVLPIGQIATILLYYDSRIRKEGFDLETLATELARTAPARVLDSTPGTPLPPGTSEGRAAGPPSGPAHEGPG